MAAAAVFLVILAGSASFTPAGAAKPWEVFNGFLRDTATAAIRASDAFSDSFDGTRAEAWQTLAKHVVNAIESATDRKTAKSVSTFGFGFNCVVWQAEVPSDYEGVLAVNPDEVVISSQYQRFARHGAAVYEGCHNSLKDMIPITIGSLGWPCPSGGATQVQAQTRSGLLVNCVTYFFSSNTCNSEMHRLIDNCRSAISIVRGKEAHSRLVSHTSPARIDLNRLVADLTATLKVQCLRGNAAYKTKAVIAVPVFEKIRPAPKLGAFSTWLGNFAGLSARAGYFIIEHIHVARSYQLDLNAPPDPGPLTLYIFFAMPSQLQCGAHEVPACYLCRN